MLARSDPARSEHLLDLAQAAIDERWRYYEQLSGVERAIPHLDDPDERVGVERQTPVEVIDHE